VNGTPIRNMPSVYGSFSRICAISALLFIMAAPALAGPAIEGSLDTVANVYSSHDQYYNRTRTECRAYENAAFDATFNDNWAFRFNSRFLYETQKRDASGNWIFNFFYGYLDFSSDKFKMQLGRIMDFNNLVFLYFDGINLEGIIKIAEHKLTLDVYGGFIVKDDYLDDYRNPWMLRSFNSTDYRNIFISQRIGDYVTGFKAEFLANKIGIFGVEYQLIFNHNVLAEHYASINFETSFSKKFKLYGYGTLDLVELLPANTLLAMQIDPVKKVSIVIEHEYYRPVFLKDSYFWIYFKPYGNQDVCARVIYMPSDKLSLDFKYALILYNTNESIGNELSFRLEHRNLAGFGLKCSADFILGPEGNLITIQAMIKRPINMIELLAGAGVEFYNDRGVGKGMDHGYFATLGTDIKIARPVVLSATGEFASNKDYAYNIRANVSLKYLF
jgi:hypothetical protein